MKNSCCFNSNVAIKILLLFGFAAFFLMTVLTGSVSMYVHPRIIPYMVFASAAMIIIAILLFRELFKPTAKKANSWPLLFFIVPLIMAFSLPAESFDSSSGTIADVQFSGTETVSSNTAEAEIIDEGEETAEDISLQDGVLVMDSSNFYECLCKIYADMDKYKGMPLEVVGFVFNDNVGFSDNEFVPARLMMVCCAADMQPVGLLCQYDQASELEADSWVKVSGTIEETEFEGDTIPVIVAQSLEMTEKPDNAYIYPY